MRRRWLNLLLFLFAFAPGLWMANYVARNAVDTAAWDMWEDGPLLQKWHDGTLTWHDLYAPQIQHRIVVPRLLIIALAHLGGGDFRWEQWAVFALAAVSATLVWVLLTRAMGRTDWRYGIQFVINLLIFSPQLYQNFFWGSALWMAIPLPCLLGALVALGSRWPLGARFGVALALAEIATHSFSHGLVIWPVVLVYLLFQLDLGTLRQRLMLSGIWLAVGAVTLACYFHDFYNVASHAYNLKPGDHAMKGEVSLGGMEGLARVIRFFVGMCGAPFARTPFTGHLVDDAQALGWWVVAPFVACAALIVFTKRGRGLWRAALPWLAVAAYVIGVALMVSLGRAHLGEHRCVLPRYFTVTHFLPIATLALAFLAAREWLWATERSARAVERVKTAGILALGLAAALQWPLWQMGLHLARIWNDARRQGRALVMFINHPELKPWSVEAVDMDVRHWGYEQTRESVNTLRSLGLFKGPVLDEASLGAFRRDKADLEGDKAAVDSVKTEGGQVTVVGNARFGTERPADLILFTKAGDDRIVALGTPTPRAMLRLYPLDYEFTNNHSVPVGEPYRWEARFPESVLQAAGGRLDVWALNVEDMRIARLKAGM